MKKLLLHCCCAPCASACVERLLDEGREIMLYFSNSNLAAEREFEKRLECVKRLASAYSLELAVDPYDHEAWRTHVSTVDAFRELPEGGARCRACFAFSLGRTAAAAERNGMNFTTSLTVSPHKNSKLVFDAGSLSPLFECYDFKKRDGFKRSLELSKKFGFYRQNFCGCQYPPAEQTDEIP